jgi:serine/threonine protein kinase
LRLIVAKVHVNLELTWIGEDPLKFFELEEKVGEGSFGSVYKAVHKDTKFVVAMKCVQLGGLQNDEIRKEIEILKQCRNPHIVNYYGSYTKDGTLWILMDYCGVGSVRDVIETLDRPLNEDQIAEIVKHTLEGLDYLHKEGIIHRDVKCANILLDENAHVKIADFGVSDQIKATYSDTLVGTPLWMAPEVIQRTKYSYQADIWSLGITTIEMADGFPPNSDLFPLRAMIMIPRKPPPTVKDPSRWSANFNDFIAQCCIKDPQKRPTAAMLLQHPFVQQAKGPDVLKSLISDVLSIKAKRKSAKRVPTLKIAKTFLEERMQKYAHVNSGVTQTKASVNSSNSSSRRDSRALSNSSDSDTVVTKKTQRAFNNLNNTNVNNADNLTNDMSDGSDQTLVIKTSRGTEDSFRNNNGTKITTSKVSLSRSQKTTESKTSSSQSVQTVFIKDASTTNSVAKSDSEDTVVVVDKTMKKSTPHAKGEVEQRIFVDVGVQTEPLPKTKLFSLKNENLLSTIVMALTLSLLFTYVLHLYKSWSVDVTPIDNSLPIVIQPNENEVNSPTDTSSQERRHPENVFNFLLSFWERR